MNWEMFCVKFQMIDHVVKSSSRPDSLNFINGSPFEQLYKVVKKCL